jgi:hypothetical protein
LESGLEIRVAQNNGVLSEIGLAELEEAVSRPLKGL